MTHRHRSPRRVRLEALEDRACPAVPAGWSLDAGGVADMRTEGISVTGQLVQPTEGGYMLWLTSLGSTPTTAYRNSLGERGTLGTVVRGPATALPAGATVSLDYFFTTSDSAPYNDFAVGLVSGRQLFQFTQTSGSVLDSGWRSARMTVPAAGTYQLVLVVSDQGDASQDSELYIDNLTGFTLPDGPGAVAPVQVSIAPVYNAAFELWGSPASMVVSRTGDTTGDLTVNYTVHGTATPGTDYAPLTGTVVIPAGEESAFVFVTAIQDTEAEGTEAVEVTLAAGDYVVGLPNTARVYVVDDDRDLPAVTVTATDADATEAGDAGVVTVTRSGDTSAPLTVSYSLFGDAVAGEDYAALSGEVVIPAGAATATITIAPIDDPLGEGREDVSVVLDYPDDYSYQVGYPGEATVFIAESDGGLAVVSIAATTPVASEATLAAGFLTVTRAGGNLALPLSVHYALDGTALPGVDYQALSGTVTISANQTTATIQVKPLHDTLGELNELVRVTLVPSAEAEYGVAYPGDHDVVTLLDNDRGQATVTVAATTAAVSEGGPGVGRFTLTRSGGNLAAPLTVTYYAWGIATAGEDYAALSGSVTFAANATTATVSVVPIDDAAGEPDEDVTLYLNDPADGSYQVDFAAAGDTVTIRDNDGGIPSVSLVATTATAAEGGAGATFTLTRSGGNLAAPLTVTYYAYGSATAGDDYAALSGTVTFAANAATATVAVAATDDAVGEPDETVSVALNFPYDGSYVVDFAAYSGTATIADNDGGIAMVTLTPAAVSVTEGGPAETFTLTRAGGNLAAPLTVTYFAYGNAVPGADYVELPGTVTFAANATTATIAVVPLDDATGELDETVSVYLSYAVDGSYTLDFSAYAGTLTVVDDDGGIPAVTLAETTASVSEGGPATTYTLTRTGGNLAAPLTVTYYAYGNATPGADYAELSGTVTFAANATTATIAIVPLDDGVGEVDETITVYLGYGAEGTYLVGSPSYGTVAILDDDGGVPVPATVSLAPAALTVAEGGLAATFTLTRTGDLAAPLTVTYYAYGTATTGADYQQLTGTVTFAAGAATATIEVVSLDDAAGEADETVSVYLGYPFDGAYLVDYSAYIGTVTIQDDDGGIPTVSLTPAAVSVAEGGPTAAFTLTRTGNLGSPLTVTYYAYGEATAGADYVELSGTVTFAAGSATAVVQVTPLDDAAGEADETVSLSLGYPFDGSYQIDPTANQGIATITDDDGGIPVVSIAVADDTAAEPGVDRGAFLVTRTGGSLGAALTVGYWVSGTATNGVDFAYLAGYVVIAANEASATITLRPLFDYQEEGEEDVALALDYGDDYTLDPELSFATVLITDAG